MIVQTSISNVVRSVNLKEGFGLPYHLYFRLKIEKIYMYLNYANYKCLLDSHTQNAHI